MSVTVLTKSWILSLTGFANNSKFTIRKAFVVFTCRKPGSLSMPVFGSGGFGLAMVNVYLKWAMCFQLYVLQTESKSTLPNYAGLTRNYLFRFGTLRCINLLNNTDKTRRFPYTSVSFR